MTLTLNFQVTSDVGMPSTRLVFCVWGTILVILHHCMVYADSSVSVIDEVVQFATLFVICFPYLALKDEVLSVYCADINLHIWACWNGATLYLLCLWIHDCFPLVLPIGSLLLHVSWIDYNPGMWISDYTYRQFSNIRRTQSQNITVSRIVLLLSLPNPLKPGVKLRMKM